MNAFQMKIKWPSYTGILGILRQNPLNKEEGKIGEHLELKILTNMFVATSFLK